MKQFSVWYNGKRKMVGTAREIEEAYGIHHDNVYTRAKKVTQHSKGVNTWPVIVPAGSEYDDVVFIKEVINRNNHRGGPHNKKLYRLIDIETGDIIMLGTIKQIAVFENTTRQAIQGRLRERRRMPPKKNIVEEI